LLEHQPFLKGVPWRQLETLAVLASYAAFPAETNVFQEGGEADTFYLLLQGRVALRSTDPRGHLATLQILEPGEPLGWSWAFPPNRWSLTAVALEPVVTVAFNAAKLRLLCDEDPTLGSILFRRIAQIVLQRLTATRRRLTALEHAATGIPLRICVAPAPPGPVPG
jgi:CRP-like cAMP-binding protein